MEYYFPSQFNNPAGLNGWIALKNRLIAEIDTALDPSEQHDKAFQEATNKVISLIKKSNLLNDELKYDKDFEKNCIILSNMINEPVDKISVRKYFTLIEYCNELAKKHGRAKDKIR